MKYMKCLLFLVALFAFVSDDNCLVRRTVGRTIGVVPIVGRPFRRAWWGGAYESPYGAAEYGSYRYRYGSWKQQYYDCDCNSCGYNMPYYNCGCNSCGC